MPSGEDSAQGSPASDAPVPTAAPNQGAAFLPTATVPPATLVPAAESREASGLCSRALCPLARSRAPPLPGGVPVPSLSPTRVPRLEAAPRPRPDPAPLHLAAGPPATPITTLYRPWVHPCRLRSKTFSGPATLPAPLQ